MIGTRISSRIAPFILIAGAAYSSASRASGDYKIALVPSRSGQHGIFVMNADTSGGKLLASDV